MWKVWMCFEQFSHGQTSLSSFKGHTFFSFLESRKVEEVVLWGLSGDKLVWRSVLVLMTQSQGIRLLGRWKPFESGRVSQVQLLRTALLSVPSLALPSPLTRNSRNCLCCQRRFNVSGFLKLRGRQGDIEAELCEIVLRHLQAGVCRCNL